MSDGSGLLGMLSVSVYAFCQKTVVNRRHFACLAEHLIMRFSYVSVYASRTVGFLVSPSTFLFLTELEALTFLI